DSRVGFNVHKVGQRDSFHRFVETSQFFRRKRRGLVDGHASGISPPLPSKEAENVFEYLRSSLPIKTWLPPRACRFPSERPPPDDLTLGRLDIDVCHARAHVAIMTVHFFVE